MNVLRAVAAASLLGCLIGCAGPDARSASERGATASEDEPLHDDGPLAQQVDTSRANLSVESVHASGSGCSEGTWERGAVAAIKPNGALFYELTFTDFSIEAGPSSTLMEAMKSCQIRVGLSFARGFKSAIQEVTFAGDVKLAAGQQARIVTDFGFNGQVPKSHAERFVGPTRAGEEAFDLTALRLDEDFSACDTRAEIVLNVTTTFVQSLPRQTGWITLGAARGRAGIANDPDSTAVKVVIALKKC